MGVLTGKADVVANMPQYNSQGENWIQWHKDLKSNFGKKIANGLWLKAWRIRGNSTANTSDLRKYMEKNGVKIAESTWDSIVDMGVGISDSIGGIFQAGKVVAIVVGVVVLGSVVMVVYNLSKNPSNVAMLTPQGRALKMSGAMKRRGGKIK